MSINQNLGALEETILLMVAVMPNEAYGFSIAEEYAKTFEKRITISAIHTVLKRLEGKGFIASQMGGATSERGGRSKRIYTVTGTGMSTLHTLQENRMKLWKMMPNVNIPR